MTLHVHDPDARLPEVKRAVTGIGYKLDRLDAPSVDTEGDSDDLPKDLSHITPAYKRALWTVVALNVGYGLLEMFGGFLSGSQADRKSVVSGKSVSVRVAHVVSRIIQKNNNIIKASEVERK